MNKYIITLIILAIATVVYFLTIGQMTDKKSRDTKIVTQEKHKPKLSEKESRKSARAAQYVIPVTIWKTSTKHIRTDKQTERILYRTKKLITSGLLGDQLKILAANGVEAGFVPACDTDFLLKVLAKSKDTSMLLAKDRLKAKKLFFKCLEELSDNHSDKKIGIVLQGSLALLLAPSDKSQPSKIIVDSWQQLEVLETKKQGKEYFYLVRAGKDETGWISAHHLAVSDKPGWKFSFGGTFFALNNYQPGDKKLLDAWFIDISKNTFFPIYANISETDYGNLNQQNNMQAIMETLFKSTKPTPIELFYLSEKEISKLLTGFYLPKKVNKLDCKQNITLLTITKTGKLKLSRGQTTIYSNTIKQIDPALDASAELFGKHKRLLAKARWNSHVYNQFIFDWALGIKQKTPKAWMKVDEDRLDEQAKRLRRQAGCLIN